MIGKPFFDVSFKQKDQAKTLDEYRIKIEKDQTIYPAFLYHMVLVILKIGDLSVELVLIFELI